MPDIDNKVVSISFNNKQFLRDVEDTISVIEELNEATSGKKIDSSGIENLGRAFRNTTGDLTKQADSVVNAFHNIQSAANTNFQTGGIDALRKALENTGMTATDVEDTITSLQQLSRTGVSYASDLGVSSTAQQIQNESANTRSVLTQDIDDVSNHFSAFEMIAMGAMIAIGEKAADIGANALRSLTSGIRDGWGEYNALTNSTQTILVNTQRWGSTMEDVSGALSVLNEYADRTTYSFSDMTRNIGYFTTAGVQLQDSIDAIQGLSNVGAMFGADAQSVARAGYQISQAMSAGVIKLMDWRSMINAGMGGQALQDELIRTAAVMSGTSVDAMNEYIESLGGFNASLQEGWLTSDIFLETMKVFAGQSRDYYRSLTDANGERLYSDEEIDRLVKLGETAMESATQVRTFQQMIDAFKESIGSGWARTFQTIIGNLEEAKEFWTPINNILTSLVDRFFTLQNASLELWRTLGGREELMQGIQNALTALSDVLGAIGRGFIAAFGGTNTIGSRLVGITEAITDFTESLMLSEEELGFVQDFFTGLFEPISLVVDVIFELIKAFFDAGDSALGLEHSADGLYDTVGRFRYALLAVLGYIGNVLKTGANFIKQSRIIRTVIQTLVKIISKTFGGLVKIISAPFVALWQVWDKYNITERLDEFATKVAEFFLPLVDAISEVNDVISDWFDTFVDSISGTITALDPIETIVQAFTALKQLFRDLFDPTISVSDAFSNFFDTMSNSNLAVIFEAIQSSFSDLWSALKETAIGQWFEDLGTRIQNAWNVISESDFGQIVGTIVDYVRDFLGIDTGKWDSFWETTANVVTTIADNLATGWEKIKNFFSELTSIVKGWFGLSDDAGADTASVLSDPIDAVEDSDLDKTPAALKGFSEGIKGVAEAIKFAEETVPDPKNSNFLTFLKDIPDYIANAVKDITDSNIAENITEFFMGIITPIIDFFSQPISEQKDDILSFLSDRVEDIANFIGNLLGIPHFSFEGGVIGVIGDIIVGLINIFDGISPSALIKAEGVVLLLKQVVITFINLRLADIMWNLSRGIRAAGKAYLVAEKTANNLAKAAKWNAIAGALTALSISILAITASIALIASMMHNGYASEIATAILFVIGILVLILAFVVLITWQCEKVKPGSLKGIEGTMTGLATVLLSIIIAIAGFFAICFAVYYITETLNASEIDQLNDAVAAVVTALVVAIGVLTGLMAFAMWLARKSYTENVDIEALAKVFSGISTILIGMAVLVAVLLGTFVGLTYFFKNLSKHDFWPVIMAILSTVVLLGMVFVVTKILISQAQAISEIKAGPDAKKFSRSLAAMAGLLTVITASVLILIAAVMSIAVITSQLKISGWYIVGAFSLVIIFLAAIFAGITFVLSQIKEMYVNDDGKYISKAFGGIILMLVIIFAGIGALVYFSYEAASNLKDVSGMVGIILSTAAILLTVIASVSLLAHILKKADEASGLKDVSLKTWLEIGGILLAVLGMVVLIAKIISQMAIAIGSSGFSDNIMWISGSLVLILAAVAGVTWAMIKIMNSITSSLFLKEKVLSVVGIFAAIAAAMTGIALALSSIANIKSTKLIIAGSVITVMLGLGVLLAFFISLMSKLFPAGSGAIGLAAVAGVITALGFSMLALGTALYMAADGFRIFSESLQSFEKVNAKDIRKNIVEISKAIPDSIHNFVDYINKSEDELTDAGKVLGKSFATSIATAITVFMTLIAASAALLGDHIGTIFISLVDSILNKIKDYLSDLLQAGSVFYELIDILSQLSVLAAKNVGYYGVLIAASFLEGIVEGLETLGIDLLIIDAINNIWTKIRIALNNIADTFWDFWTATMNAISDSVLEIQLATNSASISDIESQLETARSNANHPVTYLHGTREYVIPQADGSVSYVSADSIDNNIAALEQQLANLEQERSELENTQNYLYQQTAARFEGVDEFTQSENDRLIAIQNAVHSALEAERRTRGIINGYVENADDYTGYNTYIPDQYRGMGMDDRREINQTTSSVSSLSDALSNLFGIGGDGESLVDKLKNFLGISGDGSIADTLMTALGVGNLSNAFNSAGSSSGTSYLDGLSTSLMDGNASSIISNSVLTNDALNPVITPDVDTSLVDSKYDYITSLFKNADIDQFAIDAGNSMLVREAAEGDASKNGNVTYKFTQINQSPKELSPIQIYRDTKNLFRGVVNT